MSDNPNKDKFESEEQKTAPTVEESTPDTKPQSTIFQKHVYETKKPVKNGNIKRLIICAVALVICGAIVGSIFLTKSLLPDDTASATSSVPEESTIPVIKLKDIVKDSTVKVDGKDATVDTNIESVYFINNFDEFTVKNYFTEVEKKEKATTSSTSSTASTASTSSTAKTEYTHDTNWYVDGLDRDLTVSSAIYDAVKKCLTINAVREMPNSFSSVEEYHKYYGMKDKLTAGVVVRFNDGTDMLTISLGQAVGTGDVFYVLTTLSDTVYAITTEYADYFFCSTKEFADPTVITPIEYSEDKKFYFNENKELARFDSIKITGEVFGNKTYTFGLATGASADYMPYKMTAPYTRPASSEFIGKILKIVNDGLEASVLYSYSVTEEDRKECGLDKPKCTVEVKIDDYKVKLIIGGFRDDGTESLSAMVEGKKQVFGIDKEDLAFLINASNDITKLFNPGFILEEIYTVESFEMKVGSDKYKFNLKHTPRESDDKVMDTEVKLGSSTMNATYFKRIYGRVLMLSLLEFVTEAERAEPVLSVTFNFKDNGGSKKVDFTESPDDIYHYVAWVDGTPLGEVLKSSVTDILDCLEIYLDGGEVPDTW